MRWLNVLVFDRIMIELFYVWDGWMLWCWQGLCSCMAHSGKSEWWQQEAIILLLAVCWAHVQKWENIPPLLLTLRVLFVSLVVYCLSESSSRGQILDYLVCCHTEKATVKLATSSSESILWLHVLPNWESPRSNCCLVQWQYSWHRANQS